MPTTKFLQAFGFAMMLIVSISAQAATIEPFNENTFEQLRSTNRPVVIHAHASWCPVCAAQLATLKALLRKAVYTDVTVLEIDYDNQAGALNSLQISMQGTIIAFRGREEVMRRVGITRQEDVENILDAAINSTK